MGEEGGGGGEFFSLEKALLVSGTFSTPPPKPKSLESLFSNFPYTLNKKLLRSSKEIVKSYVNDVANEIRNQTMETYLTGAYWLYADVNAGSNIGVDVDELRERLDELVMLAAKYKSGKREVSEREEKIAKLLEEVKLLQEENEREMKRLDGWKDEFKSIASKPWKMNFIDMYIDNIGKRPEEEDGDDDEDDGDDDDDGFLVIS